MRQLCVANPFYMGRCISMQQETASWKRTIVLLNITKTCLDKKKLQETSHNSIRFDFEIDIVLFQSCFHSFHCQLEFGCRSLNVQTSFFRFSLFVSFQISAVWFVPKGLIRLVTQLLLYCKIKSCWQTLYVF